MQDQDDRFVSLGGSGNLRTTFLDEHPPTFVVDGANVEQPGRRAYGAYGNMTIDAPESIVAGTITALRP